MVFVKREGWWWGHGRMRLVWNEVRGATAGLGHCRVSVTFLVAVTKQVTEVP